MSRAGARESVRDLLVPPRSASPVWRAYVRWCEANAVPALPSPGAGLGAEDQMLAYLHVTAQERGWAAPYIVSSAGAIARALVEAGHEDPRGRRWAAYRKAMERTRPSTQAPTDGFTEAEVLNLAVAVQSARPRPADLQTAAVLAIADALGLDRPTRAVTQILAMPHGALQARERSIVVTLGERRAAVGADAHPQHFAVLDALLGAAGAAGGTPVRDIYPDPDWPRQVTRVVGAMRWALVRADRTAGTSGDRVTAGQLNGWWEAADRGTRECLIQHAAHRHWTRDRQDLAYFYTSFSFGGRYAEMKRLRLGYLQEGPDGFRGRLPASEHKGGKLAALHGLVPRPLVLQVPHAEGHPPHCPACRLSDHLNARRSRGAGDGDLVFVSSRGRELSKQAARSILDRVSAHLGPAASSASERRIGTRSMRVTTATLARLKGLSLPDIAELGNWRQLSTAERYVRVHSDYAEDDLVLSITPDPGQ